MAGRCENFVKQCDAGRRSTPRAQPLLALDRIADGGFAEVEATLDGDAESLILLP